jgi:ATP-dependent Zn protease
MPRVNDRKRTAYHEAGHAIIAWYYHIHTLGASIVKGKHSLGESHLLSHFRRLPYLQVHQLERELDLNMAGAAAVETLTGEKMSGTQWGGNDYVIAVKIAEQWVEQTGKPLMMSI